MKLVINVSKRLLNTKPSSFTKSRIRQKYVPHSIEPTKDEISYLQEFLSKHERTVILTGAGFSTESGIPDYRSDKVGLYSRKNYKPMQYQDFIKYASLRQRYWARSYVGWPGYSKIQPSKNHYIVANLEKSGVLHWLITQNVDHLHNRAGSLKVTELHGSLYSVRCLSCKMRIPRVDYQRQMEEMNQHWSVQSFERATDGDVILTDDQVKGFQVPSCTSCGGSMMPKIVFFGDNVSKSKVEFLYEKVNQSDSILVLGSSLQVYSGYRFVLRAADQGKPIAIVNIGETRADKLASLKLNVKCGDILPLLQFPASITDDLA